VNLYKLENKGRFAMLMKLFQSVRKFRLESVLGNLFLWGPEAVYSPGYKHGDSEQHSDNRKNIQESLFHANRILSVHERKAFCAWISLGKRAICRSAIFRLLIARLLVFL